jgi:hypothetical protein
MQNNPSLLRSNLFLLLKVKMLLPLRGASDPFLFLLLKSKKREEKGLLRKGQGASAEG